MDNSAILRTNSFKFDIIGICGVLCSSKFLFKNIPNIELAVIGVHALGVMMIPKTGFALSQSADKKFHFRVLFSSFICFAFIPKIALTWGWIHPHSPFKKYTKSISGGVALLSCAPSYILSSVFKNHLTEKGLISPSQNSKSGIAEFRRLDEMTQLNTLIERIEDAIIDGRKKGFDLFISEFEDTQMIKNCRPKDPENPSLEKWLESAVIYKFRNFISNQASTSLVDQAKELQRMIKNNLHHKNQLAIICYYYLDTHAELNKELGTNGKDSLLRNKKNENKVPLYNALVKMHNALRSYNTPSSF